MAQLLGTVGRDCRHHAGHFFEAMRAAVHYSRFGGHGGHGFNDNAGLTGLRHCMNGFVLTFTSAAA